jgi:acyl transferase domain-containing protein
VSESAIAVVGIGCLFPEADSPDQLWRNLLAGRDSTSTLTAAELGFDPAHLFDRRPGQPDRSYCLRGGFVRGFRLDPDGFALPPEQVGALDVSASWALYVAREALRAARRSPGRDLERCGLVLGSLSFPTRASNQHYLPLYRAAVEGALRELLDRPSTHDGDAPGDPTDGPQGPTAG